jgi:phosphoribosylamine--glycine ligase
MNTTEEAAAVEERNQKTGMHILVIGSGAREHALAEALLRSPSRPAVSCLGSTANPGIMEICRRTAGNYVIGTITSPKEAVALARSTGVNLAVIGPEAPLETGAADRLRASGIAVFGPDRDLARIETSKSYARDLLQRTVPESCPKFRIITDADDAEVFLEELGDAFVVKADGLTGGKGVKVSGEHLHSRQEALAYCRELLSTEEELSETRCLIEERLEGEEFSLMTITDGKTCRHMPVVQDHKRLLEGDSGPNTGGMGCWSTAAGTLPFLTPEDLLQAQKMNEAVAAALGRENGHPYRGVLYGGFMAVAGGVKVIEYNARFGDPEALILLTLLESDAAELFSAAASGRLDQADIRFSGKAAVCKYTVPQGYPSSPVKDAEITLPQSSGRFTIYLGSVNIDGTRLVTGGSRTAAAVALADSLEEAEAAAEAGACAITGPLFHRSDIGTAALTAAKTERMRRIRSLG